MAKLPYLTLSKRIIDRLSVDDKDTVFWDRDLRGFGIRVYPPGAKVYVVHIPQGPLWALAIIASKLHLAWIGTVCVRLRTDFSHSNTLGWNTFPVPTLTEKNRADLTICAENVLLAREAHFPATIAELYDSERMPEELRAAHDRNDAVLERIYIGRRFRNDTERLEKLFEMYTEMVGNKRVG